MSTFPFHINNSVCCYPRLRVSPAARLCVSLSAMCAVVSRAFTGEDGNERHPGSGCLTLQKKLGILSTISICSSLQLTLIMEVLM